MKDDDPKPDPVRELAEKIAADLFVDVTGRRASRLVMEFDRPFGETGWCERAVADRVEDALRAGRPDHAAE